MAASHRFGDVEITVGDDFVATMEIQRPPNNFFDLALIEALAAGIGAMDDDPACRAIVLCSDGKHFCAGANFGGGGDEVGASLDPSAPPRHIYDAAFDLFSTRTPVVAAVQGAAIGGGLGVACMPDFRFASPEARFSANFARLGFHHGFGLTVTLPRLVGDQRALDMLYTGRRLKGEEAVEIGLVDRLVPADQLRDEAHAFAREIATSAPLAVRSIRDTMRAGLADQILVATDREKAEQDWLRKTEDWSEGVRSMTERRPPEFKGK